MGPVTPFRRRSSVPVAVVAVAAAVLAFTTATVFLDWQSRHGVQQTNVQILRPTPNQSGQIDIIDGDTVRFKGEVYRLIGFDTPERGHKARCDDERRRAEEAITRLRSLVARGNARLTPVACACRQGEEDHRHCNYGRLCGSLLIDGRDVGAILISEGLAHPYVCGAKGCQPRRPWCGWRKSGD